MQEPEWFLLVAAPSALGRAPARSHPLPPAGPDPPRSRSGVRRKGGLSVHSRTLRTTDCYSRDPSTRPRGGRGAGPAARRRGCFPSPKGGDIPWALLEIAAVRAWARP